MRIDTNNQDCLNYVPNSCDCPKYCDRATERPYALSSRMVSRQSHQRDEGTDEEYV